MLPVLGAVAVALTRVDAGAYRFVTGEDALLEWLQFAAYAAGCAFALLIGRTLLRVRRHGAAVLYFLFALGCFFVGGEEIAWGQRLFGLETPEGLEAINRQREITAHNISTAQTVFNLLMLTVGFYGSVGAWVIRRRSSGTRGGSLDLFVPPLFLTAAFFVLFAYKLTRFTVASEPRYTVVVFGEWPEFCLAAALALFAALNWRRLRGEAKLELSPRPA